MSPDSVSSFLLVPFYLFFLILQGPLDGINKGGDFYLEDSDMAEDGSGGYGDSWDSSFSSYEDEYGDPGSGDDIYEIGKS